MAEKNHNLATKVMTKITNAKITPMARSHFVRRNAVRWLTAIIFVFVMGHSLGVLFYFLFDFDYALLWLYLESPVKSLVFLSLAMWFGLVAVSFAVAYWQYRQTHHGYRTETRNLAAIILIGTITIATVSYQSEVSPALDRVFGEHLPVYLDWQKQKLQVWSQPERGLLSGTVRSVEEEEIVITDLTGRVWQVQIKDALIRRRVHLTKDTVVKVIGRFERSNRFIAQEIRPWQGHGMQMKRCLEQGIALKDCIKNHGGDPQSLPP